MRASTVAAGLVGKMIVLGGDIGDVELDSTMVFSGGRAERQRLKDGQKWWTRGRGERERDFAKVYHKSMST